MTHCANCGKPSPHMVCDQCGNALQQFITAAQPVQAEECQAGASASCETQGHVYGPGAKCVFCGTDTPAAQLGAVPALSKGWISSHQRQIATQKEKHDAFEWLRGVSLGDANDGSEHAWVLMRELRRLNDSQAPAEVEGDIPVTDEMIRAGWEAAGTTSTNVAQIYKAMAARAQLGAALTATGEKDQLRAAPDEPMLRKAVVDVLEGPQLDSFGTRGEGGLRAYPDLGWVERTLRQALTATGGRDDAVTNALSFLHSQRLYSFLTNIQNGIDSPATCGEANSLIVQLDRIHAALAAAQPAQEGDHDPV